MCSKNRSIISSVKGRYICTLLNFMCRHVHQMINEMFMELIDNASELKDRSGRSLSSSHQKCATRSCSACDAVCNFALSRAAKTSSICVKSRICILGREGHQLVFYWTVVCINVGCQGLCVWQARKSSWTELNELNWTEWTERRLLTAMPRIELNELAVDPIRQTNWTERPGSWPDQADELNWTNFC